MHERVQIENIDELRLREGIDDVELKNAIRHLKAGDLVKLTLLVGAKACETQVVRITSIHGDTFRGTLMTRPLASGFAAIRVGARLVFTAMHIHSIPKIQPNRKAGIHAQPQRRDK